MEQAEEHGEQEKRFEKDMDPELKIAYDEHKQVERNGVLKRAGFTNTGATRQPTTNATLY